MTKTVKEIVDEYTNRQNRQMFNLTRFNQNGRIDEFSHVANLYRDGVKVRSLELDTTEHYYEFDAVFNAHPYDETYPLKWTHHVLHGRIVSFEQNIEE